MPKCGNCHQSHPTVADIRACYEHRAAQQSHGWRASKQETKEPEWPASEKQIKYVLGLYDERDLPPNHERYSPDQLRLMERDEVSSEINLLKTYPRNVRLENGKARREWMMPEGKYALLLNEPQQDIRKVGQGDDLRWYFFKVNKPEKGKWAGYTFIKRLIGAPGKYREEVMSRPVREKILARIEEDPKKAMTDYGLQSGRCGKCSSPLTDPESLALGIGPVCRQKMGW